jgi:RHS repeat-associated protein
MGYKDGYIDSGVASYEVDNHGQLDRPQSMTQPLSPDNNGLTYDPNGNLTSYKGWTYSYDAQNRLTSARNNGVQVASFYYDGKNRQIARNINGVIRVSVWDGWELIEEYASPVSRTAAYLQGASGVIKSWGANGTFYYDLYGTPSYFNALNNQLSTSNYSVNDLYAGERWIPELGLYDLRNRFMSPELGRFLQADPVGFKGDASNLYRYCHNDSVDFSDPMGLIDRTPSDRIWEMSCFFDSGNSFQGSLTEFMQRLTQAGMDGGGSGGRGLENEGGGDPGGGGARNSNSGGSERKRTFDSWGDPPSKLIDKTLAAVEKGKTEYYVPLGFDEKTKKWTDGGVQPGDGIKKVHDSLFNGKAEGSSIGRGDLPGNYELKAFILGHRYYDPEYMYKDMSRAKAAALDVIFVAPHKAGSGFTHHNDFVIPYDHTKPFPTLPQF